MNFFSDWGISTEAIFDTYTTIIAIFIGVAASVSTVFFSFRLRGSFVGEIMNAFSFGILLFVLGFLSNAFTWDDEAKRTIVHDSLFIFGFLIMLLGSVRMRKFIV